MVTARNMTHKGGLGWCPLNAISSSCEDGYTLCQALVVLRTVLLLTYCPSYRHQVPEDSGFSAPYVLPLLGATLWCSGQCFHL